MAGSPTPGTISTKQARIAMLARQMPGTALRSLSHHMDLEWMREAYRRTRKDGAAGVDGVTAADFAADLDANLQDLLDRAKSGTYRAPPVRRVEIPKGGGKTRPIRRRRATEADENRRYLRYTLGRPSPEAPE